jgi:hypothetical protein
MVRITTSLKLGVVTGLLLLLGLLIRVSTFTLIEVMDFLL